MKVFIYKKNKQNFYLKPLYTVELVAVEVKAAIKNRRFPSLGKVQNQISFSTIKGDDFFDLDQLRNLNVHSRMDRWT